MTTEFSTTPPPSRGLRAAELLLLVVLLAYPFDDVLPLSAGHSAQREGLTLTRLLTLVLLGVYVLSWLWFRRASLLSSLRGNCVALAMACHLTAMLLSTATSRTPGMVKGPFLQQMGVFAFYCVVVGIIGDRRMLRWTVLVFVGISVFAVGAGSYETFSHKPVLKTVRLTSEMEREGFATERSGKYRVQGLTPDPVRHGLQLMMQFGPLSCLLVTARTWKGRIGWGVLWLLALANIAASGTRAALLGAVGAFGLLALMSPLRYKRALLAGGLGAAAAGLVALFLFFPNLAMLERLKGRTGIVGSRGMSSMDFRRDLAHMCLAMFQENPLLGVGAGSFREQYPRFVDPIPGLPRSVATFAHNAYLGALAETGLVGFIAYVGLHLAIVWQLLTCWRVAGDAETKTLAAGLLGSVLGLYFCLNFNASDWGNKYVWAALGIAGGLSRVLSAERAAAVAMAPGVPAVAPSPILRSETAP